jgi:hypothetical protein
MFMTDKDSDSENTPPLIYGAILRYSYLKFCVHFLIKAIFNNL